MNGDIISLQELFLQLQRRISWGGVGRFTPIPWSAWLYAFHFIILDTIDCYQPFG
jgi:hypothetical protein